ncbi:hypothetical protein CEXT_389901 [Caerostris extrusa]|uniref:Uncharacterized protein n=1 Tax=Caerostris extrusa TaxID=172846 RepID=A0AAV4MQ21_CAEEX|nr:hypothetical protein CEXT_389901 [Caerostris extrusa]
MQLPMAKVDKTSLPENSCCLEPLTSDLNEVNNIMIVRVRNENKEENKMLFQLATLDRSIEGLKWPADDYVNEIIPNLPEMKVSEKDNSDFDYSNPDYNYERPQRPDYKTFVKKKNNTSSDDKKEKCSNAEISQSNSGKNKFRSNKSIIRRECPQSKNIDPWLRKPWEPNSGINVLQPMNSHPVPNPLINNTFPAPAPPHIPLLRATAVGSCRQVSPSNANLYGNNCPIKRLSLLENPPNGLPNVPYPTFFQSGSSHPQSTNIARNFMPNNRFTNKNPTNANSYDTNFSLNDSEYPRNTNSYQNTCNNMNIFPKPNAYVEQFGNGEANGINGYFGHESPRIFDNSQSSSGKFSNQIKRFSNPVEATNNSMEKAGNDGGNNFDTYPAFNSSTNTSVITMPIRNQRNEFNNSHSIGRFQNNNPQFFNSQIARGSNVSFSRGNRRNHHRFFQKPRFYRGQTCGPWVMNPN